MNLPDIADRFKRSIITETATRLAATHGRRKMYSAVEVRAAISAAELPDAWTGWAVAVFCTDNEFADFCASQGLTADYKTTRADVLRFLPKPAPVVSPSALAAVAATGAVATGAAAATDETSAVAIAKTLLDVVDTAGDIVGTIFDVLDIFS